MTTPNTDTAKREETSTKNKGTNGKAEAGAAGAATAGAGKGWETVQLDRPIYKPETCKGKALVGYLIGLEDMPVGDLGNWQCYVIRTTQVTFAHGINLEKTDDENDEPTEWPAGTEVLVKRTAKLMPLQRFLLRDHLIEVTITATKEHKLSGGRTLWLYSVGVNKESAIARPKHMPLVMPRPQLPAGSQGASDDLPF
jgi:hypothetical protein